MTESVSIRHATAFHPGDRQRGDHSRSQKRKLKAGIEKGRRSCQEQNHGGNRYGIQRDGTTAAPADTARPISAARRIGGRSCTIPTYASSTRNIATLTPEACKRNLRPSHNRNTTSAPTCSPAITSTWYAAVF